jgi:hypothetical protein
MEKELRVKMTIAADDGCCVGRFHPFIGHKGPSGE